MSFVLHAPLWLQLLIIGTAAWSTFQLLAFDTLLDWPRRRVLRLGFVWQPDAQRGTPESRIPEDYRLRVAQFLTCPYCAGFWIWVIWIIAWFFTHWALVPALLIGGRAIVVAEHRLLAKEEDR